MRPEQRGRRTGQVLAAATVSAVSRAIGVALAGISLILGVALLLWAVTPTSESSPIGTLRGGITAFAAAHLVPVRIGGAELSLTPLLITAILVLLLASSAPSGGRGRYGPLGISGELLTIGVTSAVYGVLVDLVCRTAGLPDTVPSTVGLTAGLIALVVVTVATLIRGGALRTALSGVVPPWAAAGTRAGVAVVAVMVAGAALAAMASLAANLPRAATLTETLAPGAGGGFGLTLLGIVYLPNATLAATGYVSGVGFGVGAGDYSPFGSLLADLPPVPLLAGIPQNLELSRVGIAALAVPFVAALVAGVFVVRRLDTRGARLAAVGLAGVVGAAGIWAGVILASGGIDPGPWTEIGAPGWKVAAVVALATWVVAGAWAVAARARQSPVAAPVGVEVSPEPSDDEPTSADDGEPIAAEPSVGPAPAVPEAAPDPIIGAAEGPDDLPVVEHAPTEGVTVADAASTTEADLPTDAEREVEEEPVPGADPPQPTADRDLPSTTVTGATASRPVPKTGATAGLVWSVVPASRRG